MFAAEDLGSVEWLERLARLSRAIGHKEFEAEIVAVLNLVLPVDHCVVFTYSADAVGHLFTHGKMPAARARELADDYVRRYHDRDPLFAKLASVDRDDSDRPQPLDLQKAYDPAYRNHFFDRNDLIDKTSTVGRVEEGSVLCNFYRMRGSGRYSAEEHQRLQRVLPLMTAFISAHYRLMRTLQPAAQGAADLSSRTRSLVHTIIGKQVQPFDRLTAREREVCERVILGYTSIGIGLDLEIALSSVHTYRKRAYEKLGIGTQNELFALCLDASQRR
jgi:DNA-binding CsgD family transcriptional regulator